MDFLDTLKSQSATWLTNFGPQIIESGLKQTGLIKVSSPPKSNLTATQVAEGQKGEYLPSPATAGTPTWLIPVVGVVALVGVIFAIRK